MMSSRDMLLDRPGDCWVKGFEPSPMAPAMLVAPATLIRSGLALRLECAELYAELPRLGEPDGYAPMLAE